MSDLLSLNTNTSRLSSIQDALQQRKAAQAQFAPIVAAKQQPAKLNTVPNEDELNKMVNDSLFSAKKGANLDRGSILNILA